MIITRQLFILCVVVVVATAISVGVWRYIESKKHKTTTTVPLLAGQLPQPSDNGDDSSSPALLVVGIIVAIIVAVVLLFFIYPRVSVSRDERALKEAVNSVFYANPAIDKEHLFAAIRNHLPSRLENKIIDDQTLSRHIESYHNDIQNAVGRAFKAHYKRPLGPITEQLRVDIHKYLRRRPVPEEMLTFHIRHYDHDDHTQSTYRKNASSLIVA